MQPYKEDSDDETGFIMAAWQPFPAPAEQQQQQQQHPPAAPPPAPKSGFARVGGGRAHYDCFWEGCSRNGDNGFASKQKISRHMQVRGIVLV